ncbi:MAG: DUF4255 domain-containing protein [Sedimenticola sp.]
MSDYRAISAVTATLRRAVQSACSAAVQNATVTLGAPSAKLAQEGKATVNLHLYRVQPNNQLTNSHLPTRRQGGDTLGPTTLALDLHYIFSFYGDAETFVPERMLGAVSLAMEQVPILGREAIKRAIEDNDELKTSDLAEAVSRVRFTRDMMTLDDFSKIWSVFYQVPYALSVAYVGSHVLLETAEPLPPPLPVAQGAVHVSSLLHQTLTIAGGDPQGKSPALWGSKLHILGNGIGRPGSTLVIGDHKIDINDEHVTEAGIVIELAPASFAGDELPAGIYSVRLLTPPAQTGTPEHLRFSTNSIAIAIHPTITVPANGVVANNQNGKVAGSIKIRFSPAIAKGQSVAAILDNRDPTKPGSHILAPEPLVDGDYPAAEMTFNFSDIPAGSYLLRTQVDGLASPVEIDENPGSIHFGKIKGPVVQLS